MNVFRRFWFWISNLGVRETTKVKAARSIRLFNRILLVYLALRLVAIIYSSASGGFGMLPVVYIFLALLLLLIFALNTQGYFLLGKYLLVGSMLAAPYLAMQDNFPLEAHFLGYYYIQVIQYTIILLLFDFYRQPFHFVFVSFLSLANLLCSDYISLYLLGLPLNSFDNLIFNTVKTVAVVAWVAATLAMYLYRSIIREAYAKMRQQQKALKRQNEQIETMNSNLAEIVSEQNLQVKSQDERLRAYAFLNAHRLRAPLSRALSIIELFKLEELEEKQTIYWLSESLRELDAVVHEINDALQPDNSTED